jgi:hypothetical protein
LVSRSFKPTHDPYTKSVRGKPKSEVGYPSLPQIGRLTSVNALGSEAHWLDQRFQAALDQAIAKGRERIEAVEATVQLKRHTKLSL